MVDTINILVRWPLLPEIAAALRLEGLYDRGNWHFETVTRRERKTGLLFQELVGYHNHLGIRVRGKDSVIEWVQASLPRLLHDYNGRLISDPFQLEASQECLFGHVAEIATTEEKLIEFLRVDLVLNLPGDPKKFVLAHRDARHPWVRRADVQYGDSGIRFPGNERVLHLYWKQKERADKSGFKLPSLANSIRAEVQLKNKKVVRETLGGNAEYPVTKLDFDQCYRIFRWAWCQFDKENLHAVSQEKCTLHGLIAVLEAQGHKLPWGSSAWEWFELGGQKPATLNRARAKVQGRKQELMRFRWADVLPVDRLPEPVVDIYPDGREVEIRAPVATDVVTVPMVTKEEVSAQW